MPLIKGAFVGEKILILSGAVNPLHFLLKINYCSSIFYVVWLSLFVNRRQARRLFQE
jgi:hypothetical protein